MGLYIEFGFVLSLLSVVQYVLRMVFNVYCVG
jgi:hypothetical protein